MKKPIADPSDVSDWIPGLARLVTLELIKENKKLSKQIKKLKPLQKVTVKPKGQKYYLRPGPKTDADMARLANKGIEE